MVQPFLTLLSHLKEMHNYAWGLNIEFKLPLIKPSNQISISKLFRPSWPFFHGLLAMRQDKGKLIRICFKSLNILSLGRVGTVLTCLEIPKLQ